jgi:hypothetical protein
MFAITAILADDACGRKKAKLVEACEIDMEGDSISKHVGGSSFVLWKVC